MIDRFFQLIPPPVIAGTGFSVAILYCLWRLWLGWTCRDWPTTEGRVVQSEIRTNQVEDEVNEILKFKYEYTIHGKTFTSRRVEMLGDVPRGEWQQILETYPVGAIVKILVRPAKPSIAVLRPTPFKEFRKQFVFFIVCLLITIALTCLIVSNPGTNVTMIPL